MKNICKVISFVFILFLCFPSFSFAREIIHDVDSTSPSKPSRSSKAVKVDDAIPKGVYYFTDRDELTSSKGKTSKTLFGEILKAKQISVAEEVRRLADSGFSTKVITGDLYAESEKISLWNYNLQDLKKRTKGMTVTMRQGSTVYKLYIPRGMENGKPVNTAIINNAIAGIKKYKLAVQEGILAGTISASFNIYSVYPSKQVPITDILEEATDDKGKKLGYKQFKSSGVKMNYSLDYFLNPLFGKIDGSALGKSNMQDFLEKKIKDVKVEHESEDKVEFDINESYATFIEEIKSGESTFTNVKDGSIINTNGLKTYKTTVSKKEYKPKSLVDGAMRLIVPRIFAKKDGGVYQIAVNGGYRLIPDVKLLISHAFVYGKEGDTFKRLGDFETYGINDKSLVLYYTTINKDGKFDPKGKKVGAVIPLWYREAVIDTSSKEQGEDNIYWTGRVVKFGNDYSGKITLNGKNKDLLSIDSKVAGKQGIPLRYFAFWSKANYTKKEDHYALDNTPDTFSIQVSFENSEDGAKGFVIYRNNYYIDDPDLIKWLETNEAKAMTDVKADKLHSLITGEFNLQKEPLSYEDWVRLKEIKSELDGTFKSKITTVIRVLSLLFGVLLISYSVILVLAYWFDIFNVLVEFSLLNLLTFRRLYPINSKEDLSYVSYSKGDVKYVTFWNLFFIMLAGMGIGLLFIFFLPVVEFISWLYYKITSWVGGI